MKCPKCSYLGFETGDRCKNCGYDFSLLPVEENPSFPAKPDLEYDYDSDLVLRDSEPEAPSPSEWFDEIDAGLSTAHTAQPAGVPRLTLAKEPSGPASPMSRSALPLFTPASADDDEPLVRVPAKPRQPLAVRRTPVARPPSMSKHILRQTPGRDHALLFGEEPEAGTSAPVESKAPFELLADRLRREPAHAQPLFTSAPDLVAVLLPSGVRPRVVAALIDHGILLAIDLAVLYFTLRMAALPMGDWGLLPPVPLLAFLVMVKLAYFTAFTAVGGQTIGKMAAGIRVVANDEGRLEISRAAERAVALLVSLITLGIGFLPALFASDRRALHDRVAHTRVVTLPSA